MAKDCWDKAEILLGKIFVPFLIPIMVAFFGYLINSSIQQEKQAQERIEHAREDALKNQEQRQQAYQKELELSQKYIEIAVGILNKQPSQAKNDIVLRNWGIKILKAYAPKEISLSNAEIEALRTHPLPVVSFQLGQFKVSSTSNPFKVCKNQTVKDSGIAIFVKTVELDNISGTRIVSGTITAPDKTAMNFTGQIGSCLSYYYYAIRVRSVSADCAEFVVSNNEKLCE